MGVRRGQVILSLGGKEQRQAKQCSDEIDQPLDGMLEKKYWKEICLFVPVQEPPSISFLFISSPRCRHPLHCSHGRVQAGLARFRFGWGFPVRADEGRGGAWQGGREGERQRRGQALILLSG